MKIFRLAGMLVVLMGEPACVSGLSDHAATLCEVVANPSSFEGVRVSLQAQVTWAFPHPTYLEDQSCGAGGVVLIAELDRPGVRNMYHAIGIRPEGIVTATITGRILTSHGTAPGIYLDAERVSNIALVDP